MPSETPGKHPSGLFSFWWKPQPSALHTHGSHLFFHLLSWVSPPHLIGPQTLDSGPILLQDDRVLTAATLFPNEGPSEVPDGHNLEDAIQPVIGSMLALMATAHPDPDFWSIQVTQVS